MADGSPGQDSRLFVPLSIAKSRWLVQAVSPQLPDGPLHVCFVVRNEGALFAVDNTTAQTHMQTPTMQCVLSASP